LKKVEDGYRSRAFVPPLKFEYNVQSVDDSRNVTKDGQQDVDEEISIAAALEEDTQRRQNDGEEDLAEVTIECEQQYPTPEAGGGERTLR